MEKIYKKRSEIMLYLAFITSLFGSIFLTASIKMLSVFHFIDWNPIGFAKKYHLFEGSHPFISWLFLVVVIFLINFILYLIMQYVHQVPAFITSLVIGGLFAVIAEWIIYDLPAELYSFKKLSIPFIVMVIITARFIFETASFHYQAHLERNRLPYKESVIK
jgi:hypothetical protein